jgi:hypothetical protein
MESVLARSCCDYCLHCANPYVSDAILCLCLININCRGLLYKGPGPTNTLELYEKAWLHVIQIFKDAGAPITWQLVRVVTTVCMYSTAV